MVFSSLLFLFAYLPLTLLLYYAVPRRWRNPMLFAASLLFYGWGEPVYILLMGLSITTAYLFGFAIEKYRDTDPKRAKRAMVASLAVNLLIFFFFKYYNFVAKNLSALPFLEIPQIPALQLPIGISFYTFQIMSYTIDLYRRDCRLQRNYVSFGTYVTLFPQLIAGPIVRYKDVDEQLSQRRENLEDFSYGVRRFCCGLAKKALVGDLMAAGYRYYRDAATLGDTTLGAWLTIIFFTLHLYYDFSGYSDMAIGLGKMFGFHFPENFNYPYIAKSITEFWRRWHISLSTWFREYVYIPLGGNRRGLGRQYLNLAVVWLLTGIWHGANWNFLLWGIYFLVILVLEKMFLLKLLKRAPGIVGHLYTMALVVVSFLLFSYTDLAAGWDCMKALVGVGVEHISTSVAAYQLLRLLPLLLVGAIGATPLPKRLLDRLTEKYPVTQVLYPVLCVGGLVLCTAYMVDSTFSPFAYLNF